MRQRLFVSALLGVVVAACSGEGSVTAPTLVQPSGFNAIGTDPVTGATIQTNKDDYTPGEVVHLVGSSWAPNETVHLFMSEEPDTHGDVSMDVQADSAGAFSLHFYDVQQHDLGVTFTLTATGQTSGSVAVATFTDGNFTIVSAFSSGIGPVFTGSILKFAQSNTCDPNSAGQSTSTGPVNTVSGPSAGVNTGQSARLTVPAALTGYTFSKWTFSATVTLREGTVDTDPSICVDGTPGGDARTFTANYTAVATNTAPVLAPIGDTSVDEGSPLVLDANASDSDTPAQTLTFSLEGAPAGATIDPITGVISWTPTDGPAQTATFTVKVTDNGSPVMSDQETITVTVNNVDPTATFNAPASVSGGSPIDLSLTGAADASSVDAAAGFTYAFDCGDGSGYGTPSATSTASCPTSGTGSRTVKGKIIDKDGGETEYTANVAINNVPPTADAAGPYDGDEGSAIPIAGTGSDPDGGSVTYAWSVAPNDGKCLFANAAAASTTVTCNDNGNWTLTLKVTDDETSFTTDDATLTVANVAPTATFNSPATVNEGEPIGLSLTNVVEPSTADVAAGFEFAFDCGDGAGYGAFSTNDATTCPTTDNGARTVQGKVRDKDGGETPYTASVIVNNVPPSVNIGAATATINEGGTFSRSGSFADPGTDTWTGTVDYGDGSGSQSLTLNADKTFSLSHVYPQDGSFTVTVTVTDDDGDADTETIALTVNNVLPVVSAGGDASISEGGTFSQNGSFTDPGADTWTATVDYGDGSGVQPLTLVGKTFSLNHVYADNVGSPFTVTVRVTDDEGSGTDQVDVTVSNVPPSISAAVAMPTVAGNLYPITQPVTVKATFGDPGTLDTHTCSSTADSPGLTSVSVGPTSASNTTCSNVFTFVEAGVYDVTVTVTDKDNGSDSRTIQVIVYDPSAGFVTGGGWIDSPAGAYYANAQLIGKATFGFVSKYVKNNPTAPIGNTQFVFHAGGFNFHSESYEFLIVNQGGTNAQFKGKGSVNGATGYSFMLWATDGSPDMFRIKIWETSTNDPVYDNLLGGADGQVQTIANGSIVIHTPKK